MSGRASIPAWQRAQAPIPSKDDAAPAETTEEQAEATTQEPAAQDSTNEGPPADDTPLLEQARRFLEDASIRDAPRDKKIVFLQSKGVSADDIETLLPSPPAENALQGIPAAAEKAWSTKSQTASSPKPQPRNVPPIVTYPEFLTTSSKPPPLITTSRLLNTAYITGGLVATMYGLSKYILAPMAQNMADSRHEFAAHTGEQLAQFTKQLAGMVSTDPANKPKPNVTNILDDISEADSDPTELFHRDFGTQTTPNLSRRPSVSSESEEKHLTVEAHENRLNIIKSHLKELEESQSKDKTSSESLQGKLTELHTYLSDMKYQNQYFTGYGAMYGANYGMPKTKDGKDDQVEALKADIRAVKGVLLSARNFPASARGR